jgi:hypothetical protein
MPTMKRPGTVGGVLGASVGGSVGLFWAAVLHTAINNPRSFQGDGWMPVMFLTCPTFEMYFVAWWFVPVSNAFLYALIFAAGTGWIQSRKN